MSKSAFCLQLHLPLTIWPDFPPKGCTLQILPIVVFQPKIPFVKINLQSFRGTWIPKFLRICGKKSYLSWSPDCTSTRRRNWQSCKMSILLHAGVNICPKKSETVYPEIWPILKLSVLINHKIFKTVY